MITFRCDLIMMYGPFPGVAPCLVAHHYRFHGSILSLPPFSPFATRIVVLLLTTLADLEVVILPGCAPFVLVAIKSDPSKTAAYFSDHARQPGCRTVPFKVIDLVPPFPAALYGQLRYRSASQAASRQIFHLHVARLPCSGSLGLSLCVVYLAM